MKTNIAMKVKVDFIEMIWDNYQGSSGKPITRSMFVEIPNATILSDIENFVVMTLSNNGIRATYEASEKVYPYNGIISITILPTIRLT